MSIVDTFDRANNTSSLGTTSDGNAIWTAVSGTWGINGNQAYISSGVAPSQATVPNVADSSGSIVLATISANAAGLVFRLTDSSNFWAVMGHPTGASQGLFKRVAGSFTHVSTFSVPAGATVSAVTSGSTITAKVNGVVAATVTDSFNSTATAWGLYCEDTSNRLDSFSIPENVPAAPAYRSPRILARSRAVSRASVI